jgi:dCTP deaminase
MIYNDSLLRHLADTGMVDPFDPECINPASIDLKLGYEYRRPFGGDWGPPQTMYSTGITICPGEFILCCSFETVCIPVDCCAELFSKSSAGRRGLEHLHAGWIDPGFCGELTFELKNVSPWEIHLLPGQRLMQMVVHQLIEAAVKDYSKTGRYMNQTGATPAREIA